MSSRISSAVPAARRFSRIATVLIIATSLAACESSDLTGSPVPAPAVARVAMSGAAWLLEQSSAVYTATVFGTDGAVRNDVVSWVSEDTTIATVQHGVVHARIPGTVTITAVAGGKSAHMRIVVRPLTVDSVFVTPLAQPLYAGEAAWLGVELRAADGRPLYDRVVTWTSLDPTIATIDEHGRIRGLKAGYVEILATSEGRSATGRLNVRASRINGSWSVSIPELRNGNTVCAVKNLAISLSQQDAQLTGGVLYDMWTGTQAGSVECAPTEGTEGPWTSPALPAGEFVGMVHPNGYLEISFPQSGWSLSGMLDRATGTWTGTATYRDGETVNGVTPIRTGSFAARKQ